MAYKNTIYKNNEQPALNEANLNKLEKSLKNTTTWLNAESKEEATYEIKIDNWKTEKNSLINISFETAKDVNAIAMLKINDEKEYFILNDKNNKLLGKDIENSMVILKFNGEDFEMFSNKKIIVDLIYPVGSIYLSVNNVNPSTIFGGVWISWSNGRVPVGVDPADTKFNAVEKEGGTQEQIFGLGTGYGKLTGFSASSKICWDYKTTPNYQTRFRITGTTAASEINSTSPDGLALGGTTDSNSILQPYITCYMWKRTD